MPGDSLISEETQSLGRWKTLWIVGSRHSSSSSFPVIRIPILDHGSSQAGGGVKWRRESVGLVSQRSHFTPWLSHAHPIHSLRDIWWLTGSVALGKVPSLLWIWICPSRLWRWSSYLVGSVANVTRVRCKQRWCLVGVSSHIHSLSQQNQPSFVRSFLTRLVGWLLLLPRDTGGREIYYMKTIWMRL